MDQTIKIITDGGCDLPKELTESLDIAIVPLSIHFESESFTSHMDTAEYYTKMKSDKQLPKTSSPSPQDFLQYFHEAGEHRDILVVTLSSNLSSTYNHALMAKDMLIEEGYQGSIEIIDSKTASLGQGILAYQAAQLVQQGIPFTELVQIMQQSRDNVSTLFVLDTLENVIKGGRLDRVRGTVASVLNIKLLMRASTEGTVGVIEKVRGSQPALKRLFEKVTEANPDYKQGIIAIGHGNCEVRARGFLESLLKKYPYRQVIFSNMGPVIGTYAGEGAVLVAFS
ncbi:DegV domain-containing protein [compost metagenome]